MTPDEFNALPPAHAQRVVLQLLAELLSVSKVGAALAHIEAPKQPRSPKYDFRIRRKGGYAWASETDLDGLRFWCGKYRESAAQGGEYAEKDEKNAEKLQYWIAWREVSPKEQWTGQRNDDVVTAAVPSHKPRIYEWEAKRTAPEPSNNGDAYEEPGGDDSFPAGW